MTLCADPSLGGVLLLCWPKEVTKKRPFGAQPIAAQPDSRFLCPSFHVRSLEEGCHASLGAIDTRLRINRSPSLPSV